MRRFLTIVSSSVLAAIAVTIATSRDARADAPRLTLGRTGQVVLDDLIGFRTGAPAVVGPVGLVVGAGVGRAGPVGGPSLGGLIGYSHFEWSSAGPNVMSSRGDMFWVAPSVDFFVGHRVSLGISLGVSYSRTVIDGGSSSETGSSLSMAAMPRIGYALPLGYGFSIWPRVGLGYARSRVNMTDVWGSYESTAVRWIGGADLGLIFQATPHVFVAMRPELTVSYVTAPSAPGVASFTVGLGGAVGLGVTL